MKRLGLMLSVVAMTYATSAVAELKGTYGFAGTGMCLYPVPAFLDITVPFIAPESGYFTSYFSAQGTRTFNGDGTGSIQQFVLAFRLSPQLNVFDPFSNANTSTASFTYTVTDDIVTINNVPGTFKGIGTAGFGKGSTFTLENIPPATGQISKDHKTITEAFRTPGVETQIMQNGTFFTRVCTNARILIRMDADAAN